MNEEEGPPSVSARDVGEKQYQAEAEVLEVDGWPGFGGWPG